MLAQMSFAQVTARQAGGWTDIDKMGEQKIESEFESGEPPKQCRASLSGHSSREGIVIVDHVDHAYHMI